MADDRMKSLRDLLKRMTPQLKAALPNHIPEERFLRIMLTTIARDHTGKLLACSFTSILGAMMEAAQDGLELDGVHAALVPYKDQGELRSHYQQMYRGMIARARRSGDVSNIRARPVYEGDIFEYEDGLCPKLRHVRNLDAEQTDDKIRCFYSIVDFKDGTHSFEIMTRAEVEKVRKSSRAYEYDPEGSPWATNYPEMGCKTVARRHLKWCPMASDFQRSLTRDELSERGKLPPVDIDVPALPEAQEREAMPAEVTNPEAKAAAMAEDIRKRTAGRRQAAQPKPPAEHKVTEKGKPQPQQTSLGEEPPPPDMPPPGDAEGVIHGA